MVTGGPENSEEEQRVRITAATYCYELQDACFIFSLDTFMYPIYRDRWVPPSLAGCDLIA